MFFVFVFSLTSISIADFQQKSSLFFHQSLRLSRFSASSNRWRSHFGQTSLKPQSFLTSIGCSLSQFQHLKVSLFFFSSFNHGSTENTDISPPFSALLRIPSFIALSLSLITVYIVSHFTRKVKLYFHFFSLFFSICRETHYCWPWATRPFRPYRFHDESSRKFLDCSKRFCVRP